MCKTPDDPVEQFLRPYITDQAPGTPDKLRPTPDKLLPVAAFISVLLHQPGGDAAVSTFRSARKVDAGQFLRQNNLLGTKTSDIS